MNPHQIIERPRRVRLPIEILVMIIELPIQKDSKAILRASDPITKWLLAFTRVCKATYPTASKLLWRYCLCIDSKQRALDFMRCLANPLYYPPREPWKVRNEARLFLAPFPPNFEPQNSNEEPQPEVSSAPVEEPEPQTIELQEPPARRPDLGTLIDPADFETSSEINYSSDSDSVRPRRSFIFRHQPPPLDDLETARTTQGILATLAPILKTLIIDIPLRSLKPHADDKGIRRILRRGFEALENLEEVVSVYDNLFLEVTASYYEENVWSTCWPKLRRLCLYGQKVDEEFWATLAHHRRLETVILSDPGSKYSLDGGWDIKGHWFDNLPGKRKYPRKMNLVLLNCIGREVDLRMYAASWQKLDPKNLVNIREFTLQTPLIEAYDGPINDWPLGPADLCQYFVTEKALDGTLWNDALKKHEAWLKDPGPRKERAQYW